MGEPLRLSPLIEAICEFRFAALEGDSWDLTIPGRLYNLICDEFSINSQVSEIGIQFHVSSSGTSQAISETPRFQLRRPDGSAMVQTGPNLLVINHLQPYQSWEVFSSLIVRIFSEYVTLLGEFNLKQIGLRYINNISLKDEGDLFEISDYLNTKPNLLNSLDRPLLSFHQRYDIFYEELSAKLVHQTAIVSKSDTESVLVLDLDFNSDRVGDFNDLDKVKSWIDKAHDCIDSAFIDSLNIKYYEKIK
jgi:uncharacterized protein (TIGR04255 family)